MSRVTSFASLTHSQGRERFYYVVHDLLYVGLFVHALLIPVFLTLGLTTLALTNVLSVALYLIGIGIGRRAHTDASFLIGAFEILAHSTLAVVFIGWHGGFQYYIFVVAVLVFLHPSERTGVKALAAALMYLLFVSLSDLAQVSPPIVTMDTEILRAFEAFNVSTFFFLIVFLAFLYHRAAGRAEAQLKSANHALDQLARIDELTGLANRRAMIEALESAAAASENDNRPFSVILCDVDGFKQINDQLGHNRGDEILRRAATHLRAAIRDQDLVARWGGEEFLVLLPGTDLAAAGPIAERIRRHISEASGRVVDGVHLTLTFGVSVHHPGRPIDATISAADGALYAGKRQGKNCVVLASLAESAPG
ncbi:MAG: GGDEF domain-containing protein [Anaerolineales bacterium]|nr:GGDEF domain-containing protein [Anaerolineales bacterium]